MEAKAQLDNKHEAMFWAVMKFYGTCQKSETLRICIKKTYMQTLHENPGKEAT